MLAICQGLVYLMDPEIVQTILIYNPHLNGMFYTLQPRRTFINDPDFYGYFLDQRPEIYGVLWSPDMQSRAFIMSPTRLIPLLQMTKWHVLMSRGAAFPRNVVEANMIDPMIDKLIQAERKIMRYEQANRVAAVDLLRFGPPLPQ
ncbi:unnamed protein product [Caenorhabditis auriculariae]|uniref:Uncharacterized protein n=1 Tax=Caenorhabditis auriculariae TaxID=2777116 RepID=A0A8S1HS39_9PELO|nr:unnamed protein product [Caenorhabditis auriculariae]